MRVGFFGGSFDPPHLGHVAIARAAAETFALETVFFAPTGLQPLKPEGASASFSDRLTMTALACGEDARFAVSNVDAPMADGRPNYTARTLGLLSEMLPEAELFAVIGADSFQQFAEWREPYRLLAQAQWIVISRPGFALEAPRGLALTAAQRERIHLLDAVHADVAASSLRLRLAAGDACGDLLPGPVSRYIQMNGLYGFAK